VCSRANLTEIPLPVYKQNVKRKMLYLARVKKKDREVRAGLRTLKSILGHGRTSKAERKEKKYATQTKSRLKKSNAMV
jgi:hypothetical protein